MKRFFSFLALAGLTVGLALPIVADEKFGKAGKACCGEMVSIDKPFTDVIGRVPGALKGANLILAGDIDWAKLGMAKGTTPHGSGTMPGEMPRLEAGTTNIHTFLIADDYLVTEVRNDPLHAMWIGKMVIFEKEGKTQLFYLKPSLMAEQLKKSGAIPADKFDDHMKKTQDYEKKVEQAVNALK